jgi:PAS domain S-box-containing protein
VADDVPTLQRFRSPVVSYGIAALAVVGATVCNLGFQELVGGIAPYVVYFPVLITVGLFAGLAPAFAALVASAVVVSMLWMEPVGWPWALALHEIWATLGFLASGGLTVMVASRFREHARRLEQQHVLIERQRAELKTMLDLIPVGVMMSRDPRGDSISVNRAFATTFGLRPGQDASLSGPDRASVPYRALRNDMELSGDELPMQVAARTGREVSDFDCELVFEDGRVLEVRSSAAPIFDEKGRVRGAIGTCVDVTALREAARTLDDASRRKDEFIATLAHELRNPIAPIRYAAARLRRDSSGCAVAEVAAIIERQCAHVARLLDDLLDLSRITRNAISLRREAVDLRDVVQQAVEAERPAFSAKRIAVQCGFPDTAAWVTGDRDRLIQVVSNLLSNAGKFTPADGSVEVRVVRDSRQVHVVVRDTGLGLTLEMISRIFDLFVQAHPDDGSSQRGLGIGLSMVQRLVRLHGGEVKVRSGGLGEGAEFVVSLPETDIRTAPPPRAESKAKGQESLEGLRILVVDDNRDAADALAALLQLLGLEVAVAYDGVAATGLVEKMRPDVVLLDIGMPTMDGIAVASWIRSQPWGSAIRLIAVTGWGQAHDRARTAGAGFDLHLTKPVDPDELVRRLAQRGA